MDNWSFGTGIYNNTVSGFGGGKGGGVVTSKTPGVLTFTDGEYTIVITEKLSRAAYDPKVGDSYKVYEGEVLISEGTITSKVTEGDVTTFIFTPDPSVSGAEPFTATLQFGLLEVVGGEITGKDGETYSIPSLSEQHYEGGVANSDPILDEENHTIAGCAYDPAKIDEGGSTWSHEGTHYLISGTYAAAKAALIAEWGPPGYDSEDPADPYYGDEFGIGGWSEIARQGVLLEIDNHESTDLGGSPSSGIDLRLAVWVSVGTGGMEAGAWKVAGWGGGPGGVTVPVPDTAKKEIAGLKYTDKKDFSSTTASEWTNYILTISYDAALTILKGLWGNPQAGWSIVSGGTNTEDAFVANGVVFGIATFTGESEDGQWTNTDYRLAKVEGTTSKRWKAVGWYRWSGHH